jgi:toxin HigB-1
MLVQFHNDYLEKLFTGEPTKGKPKYSEIIVIKFKKCVLILKTVENSVELAKFRGLNFEALKGDKNGLYSIRVDDGYRLEFKIEKDVIEIVHIEELSNHYK